MNKDWKCPEGCKGVPAYGYECPDDLFPDEWRPMGIPIEIEDKKETKKYMAADKKDTKIVIGPLRLSYPKLFVPEENDQGVLKYGAAFLVPKSDTKTIAAINAAVEAAKVAGVADKWKNKVPPNLKMPLRDGDTEKDAPEYAGHMFFNANSNNKPIVLDRAKNKLDEDKFGDVIYAGCYVYGSFNAFAFEAKGNKGVALGLQGVMKWVDGERLAGGGSVADFDGIDAEVDTDDMGL